MSCQTCNSERLFRMEIKDASPSNGIVCLNCGQMQGDFPQPEGKIPLGSFLGESLISMSPGEKGKFRLISHLSGKPIKYERLKEVETVWHGQDPIQKNELVELSFFSEENSLDDLHANLIGMYSIYKVLKPQEDTDWLVQHLLTQASPDDVIVLGECPWLGKITLIVSSDEFLIRDEGGVSHEVQKSKIMLNIPELITK